MMNEVAYEGRDLEVLAEMPNYYSWIFETFKPYVKSRVVEYGAGSGTISARLAPLAQQLTLVEPSINLTAVLRKRFGDTGKVTVVGEALENHVAGTAAGSFETVVLVNVLEHIDNDRHALAELFRILCSGGYLLLFVPALEQLMSPLDKLHGHFRRYHRPDLMAKVGEAGGEVLSCRYFDIFGVLPWFLLNTLLGSTTFNPSLVAFNDRVVVPVSRLAEKAIRPSFGKNLLLVARKPH